MADKKTFKDLGLSETVLNAINKKGFEEPTDIQAMTIPVMLKDETHIIAQAQTGTGKTAAFGLPLIETINRSSKSVQALILAPTRELAIQISEEINSLKGEQELTIVPIYGGQSIDQQLRRLKKGAHIVVGTPGRVLDHIKRKTLKLGGINHLILDEADEMLNMGFIEDVEKIMEHTSTDKKVLMFSATMPEKIKSLAKKYMEGHQLLAVKRSQLTTNLTQQIYYEIKASDKFESLCRIIDIEENFYGIIFCRTRSDVDSVVTKLADRGYDAEAIHGDIPQMQRVKSLDNFKKKKVHIIIATDVAARGIDVNDLTHVINFSLPQDPEAYVHRIGRTGRAGKQGTAITLITPSEYKRLMFIQRVAKTDIKKSSVPKVEEIIDAKKKKIQEDLSRALEDEREIESGYFEWAKDLLSIEDKKPSQILAALLHHCFEDDIDPSVYGNIREFGKNKNDAQIDMQGKARLFVALGKKDDLNAKKLVDLIQSKVSIKSKNIIDVAVMDVFSFITVPFAKAELIINSFSKDGPKPLVTHYKGKEGDKKKDFKKKDKGNKKEYKRDYKRDDYKKDKKRKKKKEN